MIIPIPAGATEIDLSFNNIVTEPNEPPIVNAGLDKTITLPINRVTLDGTSNDPEGGPVTYLWSKTSGGNAEIVSPNKAITDVTGLVAGSYKFSLSSKDDKGNQSFDEVVITVKEAVVTPPPTGDYKLIYENNFTKLDSNQLGRGTILQKDGINWFRAEVKQGDSQISGGYRSEQQLSESLSQTGGEYATEYDQIFESFPSGVTGLSQQWHGNTEGTSGQMSMWITGGKFMVQRNIIGKANSPNIYQSGTLKTIEKGRKYHIRWEYKFSKGSDGYVRVYIDNVLYYSVNGQTSDGSGQYPKIGGMNLFKSDNVVILTSNYKIYKK